MEIFLKCYYIHIKCIKNKNMNFLSFFPQLDFSKPSWDLFIVLIFLVGGLVYGLTLGRDRVIVMIVSIYTALALITSLPYLKDIGEEGGMTFGMDNYFVLKLLAFVILFSVLFFLFSKSALFRTVAASEAAGSIFHVLIFSFLHIGMLISIILSFLSPEAANMQLTPFVRTFFTTDMARFAWLSSPIGLMVLFSFKREEG